MTTTFSHTEMNISEIFPFASNIEFGYPSYTSVTKDRFDRCRSFDTHEHQISSSDQRIISGEKSDLLLSRSKLNSSNSRTMWDQPTACDWAEECREERGEEGDRLPSGYNVGYDSYRTVV
ncbi:MAG: hypothetical protein PHG66_04540 [Candidatus Colwellbacteria bacterium]|nr:hypothetical protein [Candidatus Colwellbacteria bacterium]